MATSSATSELAARAEGVAAHLALMASAPRLMILCHLVEHGESSVSAIRATVGLSQSALSQHLARLREAGLVATRRDGQAIHYRLADEATRAIMAALYDTFCAPDGEKSR